MYSISFSDDSKKQLKKIASKERILKKIYSIKDNPFRYIKRLKDERLWSLRIGDNRAILIIKDKTILIMNIGKRDKIYDEIS